MLEQNPLINSPANPSPTPPQPAPAPTLSAEPMFVIDIESPTVPLTNTPFPGVQASTPMPENPPIAEDNPDETLVAPSPLKQAIFYIGLILLVVQGLRGLYTIIYFILQEFPIFEKALANAQIDENSVNQLALKVGLMILATAMSFFFAVQMTLVHERMNKIITLILSFSICIISFFVLQYAQSLSVVPLN